MNRATLIVDVAIAAILTILIVVLSPGLAVVGLIALLVVLVCAVSFALDRLRRKPSRREPPLSGSRSRSPRRSPRRG
jgi:ABC-type bacteriocin/lantibiotic exporter with double-glycine peptidase domain